MLANGSLSEVMAEIQCFSFNQFIILISTASIQYCFTNMLEFMVTSKIYVTTVYNKIIANIQCHLLLNSLRLKSTIMTRNYNRFLW